MTPIARWYPDTKSWHRSLVNDIFIAHMESVCAIYRTDSLLTLIIPPTDNETMTAMDLFIKRRGNGR